MKVCKQTDPEKGLTPVNRNVKDLRMADDSYTSDPNGVEPYNL